MTRTELLKAALLELYMATGQVSTELSWMQRFLDARKQADAALNSTLPPEPPAQPATPAEKRTTLSPTARQAAEEAISKMSAFGKPYESKAGEAYWKWKRDDETNGDAFARLACQLRTALDDEAKAEPHTYAHRTAEEWYWKWKECSDQYSGLKKEMDEAEKPLNDSEREEIRKLCKLNPSSFLSPHIISILTRKGTTGADVPQGPGPETTSVSSAAPASPEDHGCPAQHPVTGGKCVLAKGHFPVRHACRADDDFWYWTIPDQPAKGEEPSAPASPDPVAEAEKKAIEAVIAWRVGRHIFQEGSISEAADILIAARAAATDPAKREGT
jgi:hypothetical protein